MGVQNLIVRDNKITNCNVNGWGNGVVELKCDIMGVISDRVVIDNVTFEGNIVTNSYIGAFSISSSDNIRLIGNTFKDTESRINNSASRAVINISKSQRITVKDNVWIASDYVVNPATVIVSEADRTALITNENNIVS